MAALATGETRVTIKSESLACAATAAIRLAALLAAGLVGTGCNLPAWRMPPGHPADPTLQSPATAPSPGAFDRYRSSVRQAATASHAGYPPAGTGKPHGLQNGGPDSEARP
jgi:hypothetical protein